MQDIVTLPLYHDGIMCVEVMLFVTAICHVVAPPGSCRLSYAVLWFDQPHVCAIDE